MDKNVKKVCVPRASGSGQVQLRNQLILTKLAQYVSTLCVLTGIMELILFYKISVSLVDVWFPGIRNVNKCQIQANGLDYEPEPDLNLRLWGHKKKEFISLVWHTIYDSFRFWSLHDYLQCFLCGQAICRSKLTGSACADLCFVDACVWICKHPGNIWCFVKTYFLCGKRQKQQEFFSCPNRRPTVFYFLLHFELTAEIINLSVCAPHQINTDLLFA